MAKVCITHNVAAAVAAKRVIIAAPSGPTPRPSGRFLEQKKSGSFKGFKLER